MIEDAAFGLVLASAQTPQDLPINIPFSNFRFVGLKASAASAGFVGLDADILTLTVRGITVEVNTGSPAPPGGVPPAINWKQYALDNGCTEEDLAAAAAGDPVGPDCEPFEVETGDPDNPIVLDADGFRIGGGVALLVLGIGEWVHLRGAAHFELGRTATVPLVGVVEPSVLAGSAG